MQTLKIQGMTCQHCVQAVTAALAAVQGVERVVSVDLEHGEATIEGSPAIGDLVTAVEEQGYRAEVLP